LTTSLAQRAHHQHQLQQQCFLYNPLIVGLKSCLPFADLAFTPSTLLSQISPIFLFLLFEWSLIFNYKHQKIFTLDKNLSSLLKE